jgi:hypothetical protein
MGNFLHANRHTTTPTAYCPPKITQWLATHLRNHLLLEDFWGKLTDGS